MIAFHEEETADLLKNLPACLRVVFALLCALRIIPMYRRYTEKTGRGDPDKLKDLLEQLWRDTHESTSAHDELEVAAEQVLDLVPSEDDEPWDEETQPYAENAAAAVAYAYRARLNDDPQEAAFAARRLYEAADHFARTCAPGDAESENKSESALLAHPVVQAELARQERDLRELAAIIETTDMATQTRTMRERSEREAAQFFTPA